MLEPCLINLKDCSRNQTKFFYSIENYNETRLLNIFDTFKIKTKVTNESSPPMNTLKIMSLKVKKSYLCHGIAKDTGDKIQFYIAEQLRIIANSFESKELFMNDDIMESIFSGTGIKTDDGVKIISSGGNNYYLCSSKCEMSFLSNDSSCCKHCRLLIKKCYYIINRSSLSTTIHSKNVNINVITKNPVSSDFEIQNNRNINFNLHRKVTRVKNKERLEQLGQTTNNEEDTNHIREIFLNADKNVSTVLDPDLKEMELWKIHYKHISSVNKPIAKIIVQDLIHYF